MERQQFHEEQQVDFPELWWRLDTQLYPRRLSEFARPGQCRVHKTEEHDEMHCLKYLSRMESAAQGKIFFWDVPRPEIEEGNFSLPETKDPLLSFVWMIESQLVLDGEMRLENILLPLWCRIHNSPHSEFTCSVCEMAINQVRNQFGMPTLSEEECIMNRSWGAHLAAKFRRTYEQDIAPTSECEKDQVYVDDTNAPDDQCITMDSLPCLAPEKEYYETKVEELVENIQAIIKEDPGVEQATKGKDDSFLEEFSLMLQKEILEIELQEFSNGLIEEDNQVDILNKEIQVDILSKPRYEEQFKGALEDFIPIMLFEETLKDLVKETQMESLSKIFLDKQVTGSDMIQHQLRPPDAILEGERPPEIIFDPLEEMFEDQSIKETLIFEDMLTKFHEDAFRYFILCMMVYKIHVNRGLTKELGNLYHHKKCIYHSLSCTLSIYWDQT